MSLSFKYISNEYIDQINKFDCDNPSVNEFFKENSIELHECNYCITKLAFKENQLVGFISSRVGEISAKGVNIRELGWDSTLPKTAFYSHSYPIVHIQFIGVDKEFKGEGIGKSLMLDMFESVYDLMDNFGCNFIYLDSYLTEEALGFYNNFDFVEIERDEILGTSKMLFKVEKH